MSTPDQKRQLILDAAITQFSQYGFRKTSMEDIARAAEVSRPSLYSYFENKEEIFRSLSQFLNEQSFEHARAALTETRGCQPVVQRIEGALLAFNVSLYRRLDESAHGAELMDESNRLCGDIAQTFYGNFQELVASELAYADGAGELNLSAAGVDATEAAEVIRYAVIGLKTKAADSAAFQKRVEQFIRVYLGGLA